MSERLPAPDEDRRTILDLVDRNIALLANRPMTTDDGVTYTWRQYGDMAGATALLYRELGLERGDMVGIHQRNRFEHIVADTGAVLLGAIPVSLYNTLSPEQLEFIATDTQMRVLVVEERFLDQWRSILAKLPNLSHVIVVDGSPDGLDSGLSWEDALQRGSELLATDDGRSLADARAAITPDDVVTIVYTSGTTGTPKGVLLTHGRIRFTLDMVTAHFRRQVEADRQRRGPGTREDPTAAGSRLLSYLPLAHAAERFASYYLALQWGSHVHYARELDQLAVELPAVRPSFLMAVPRVWEKFASGMRTKLSGGGPRAALGRAALNVATQAGVHRMNGTQPGLGLRLQHAIFEKALYPKMRQAMGLDCCGLAMSGAAPIDTALLCMFTGMGLPIVEGYGMTETHGIATLCSLDELKPGSVGKTFHPEVSVRIATDGEILVRGPHLTPGYHNRPDATAEALDSDGWLHTGDLGELDPDGSLRMTGRKKELIITSAGKNISPDAIEKAIKRESNLISHVVAVGDRRNYITALVVLDPDALAKWAEQSGLSGAFADLARNALIHSVIEDAVTAGNVHLSRVEQIKRFTIVDQPWDATSPELTPTLKLRRSVITERHHDAIDAMYRETQHA